MRNAGADLDEPTHRRVEVRGGMHPYPDSRAASRPGTEQNEISIAKFAPIPPRRDLRPCTRRAHLGERKWRVAVERSNPRKEWEAPRFCATFARRT